MADIIEAVPQIPPGPGHEIPARTSTPSIWPRLALGGVMLVSLFMNFF